MDKNDMMANLIVAAIYEDVLARKGIKSAFKECDDDIIEEIKTDWKKEILKILRRS